MDATTIEQIESGGQMVVRFEGAVRRDTAWRLGDQLRAVQSQGPPVVLDLRRATELDDEVLWSIAEADRRARDRGSRLRMIPGGDAVQRTLRAVDLERRLLIVAPQTPMS